MRIGAREVRALIASYGPAVAVACAYGALVRNQLKSRKALDIALEAITALPTDAEEPEVALPAPTPQPQASDSTAADETRRLRHDLKLVTRELKSAKNQIAQLTKKNAELSRQLAEARESAQAARSEHKRLTAAHESAEREIRSLNEQKEELTKGKKTLEDRLARQEELFAEERRGLLERNRAAEEAAEREKERAEVLERSLDDERRRREQVEALIEETGLVRLLEGLRGLEDTITTLEMLRRGLLGYQNRLDAEEQRRRSEMEELREKSRAAEEARRKQEEIEAAWRERASERLSALEHSIFGQTPPDVVLIDGHNVIIPPFGKPAEKERRSWLIENVRRMTERLAKKHPDIEVVLCFDTQFEADRIRESPNLVIQYCLNTGDGDGADAAIRTRIEEGHPATRYLVVSSDRKHVWADAFAAREELDSRVALIQGEKLIEYFDALERVDQAES
ncbi:MAG: hypothetical protein QMC94_01710 [Anaerosomatales bacterium]|nr:hypothetical protein [Anaerosomatales bacterium]